MLEDGRHEEANKESDTEELNACSDKTGVEEIKEEYDNETARKDSYS